MPTTAQKLLNGIMKYRNTIRQDLVKHFEFIQSNPNPKTIFFTCVDSRVVASRVLQADPGITYLLRNPGNIIPNYKNTAKYTPMAEGAALELAFVFNRVHSVAVCGHSDCHTLHLLHDLHYQTNLNNSNVKLDTHLKEWLLAHGSDSIQKFSESKKNNFKKPVLFTRADGIEFEAFIDIENKFDFPDKLSQIHVLEQLKNLSTYNFLHEKLKKKVFQAHALWFDVSDGELYMFSFDAKKFIRIDEESFDALYKEAELPNLKSE